MRRHSDTRHIVDTLFVLALFAVFAICSMLLITFGANIYKKTVDNLDEHYNLTTSTTYITEKFRHSDSAGAHSVTSFGDGNAFKINSIVDNVHYSTYIYQDNGYLKELYTKSENPLPPESGQRLLPINSFDVEKKNDYTYIFSIEDTSGQRTSFTLSSKCR